MCVPPARVSNQQHQPSFCLASSQPEPTLTSLPTFVSETTVSTTSTDDGLAQSSLVDLHLDGTASTFAAKSFQLVYKVTEGGAAIVFDMSAPTLGYVALGWSASAVHVNAVMYVGFVDDSTGQARVLNTFSTEEDQPPLSDDVNRERSGGEKENADICFVAALNVTGSQLDGVTRVQFALRLDQPSKANDAALLAGGDVLLHWAYHADDPFFSTRTNEWAFDDHKDDAGKAKLNLLAIGSSATGDDQYGALTAGGVVTLVWLCGVALAAVVSCARGDGLARAVSWRRAASRVAATDMTVMTAAGRKDYDSASENELSVDVGEGDNDNDGAAIELEHVATAAMHSRVRDQLRRPLPWGDATVAHAIALAVWVSKRLLCWRYPVRAGCSLTRSARWRAPTRYSVWRWRCTTRR